MTSYAYPCCGDSYNIRMYDDAGAIVWTASLANGATITHLAMHGDDYLYLSVIHGTSTGGLSNGKFLFKYDITGASPSLVWEASATTAILGSVSERLSGIAVNQSSGDIYCVTQNNYTPIAPQLPPASDQSLTGYYILRYSSAGVYLGRRKIQFINNYTGHTAYRDGLYQNARGGPICIDSSGYVYVGLQGTYTSEGADGIAHLPAPAGTRVINVAKYNADLSTADAFCTHDYSDLSTLSAPDVAGGIGLDIIRVQDLIVDGTNLYWCVSGYRYPSGLRVVSGMNKSTGASAWPAGAENSSKNFGYGKIRSIDTSGLIFAGRTQEAQSGYTNGSLRSWGPTGTYSHAISGVAYSNAIDITPDAMLVATRIVNVDQYAASDPSPEVRQMLSGTLVHELDYVNNGSARRPLAAKALSDSHPLNPTGFILAGYLIP